jgi:hypothetical protein
MVRTVLPPKKTAKQPSLPRGFTPQPGHSPDSRPPNLQGRVFNEFRPDVARGSTMPPPTGDTEEPRGGKRSGKGLSKGQKRR